MPKRTTVNRVSRMPLPGRLDDPLGHRLRVAPITVRGLTALSVETRTKRSTPAAAAVFAVTRVAIALLRTASSGFASISGTCL